MDASTKYLQEGQLKEIGSEDRTRVVKRLVTRTGSKQEQDPEMAWWKQRKIWRLSSTRQDVVQEIRWNTMWRIGLDANLECRGEGGRQTTMAKSINDGSIQ